MLRMTVAMLVIAGAITLAACGGSSSSSTASSAKATAQNAGGQSRIASLRACLQKQGITLPSAPSGAGGQPGAAPGNGTPPAGGATPPEGGSQSKVQEAIKKCGGGSFPGGGRPGFNGAAAQTALAKYSACMRENGVNLPAPNTSGNGPVFNTKGIDTSSAAFKSAQKKCQSDLKGAFGTGRPPAGGGEGGSPPGGPGGPPSGEEAG
jgi:hypothetical protein